MVVAAALVGCSKESSKTEGAAASASTPIASATAPASAATPAPSDSTPAAAASGDPPTEEQYEQKAATTITSSTLKAQLDQLDKEVGN